MSDSRHHNTSIALIAAAVSILIAEIAAAFSVLDKMSEIGYWIVVVLTLLSATSLFFSIYHGGKGMQKSSVEPGSGNPFDMQAKYGLFGIALFVVNIMALFIDMS